MNTPRFARKPTPSMESPASAASSAIDDADRAGVIRSFLFTDIVESTTHWERAEEAYCTALDLYNEIIRRELRACGGQELLEAGDGFLIAFHEAEVGLRCAIAAQTALMLARWPAAIGRLQVRMGLHRGTVEPRPGDEYRGIVLNCGARLTNAAHGGQIVCSSEIADCVVEGIGFKSLGVFRLRGITSPRHLHQVCWPGMPLDEFPPPQALPAYSSNLVPSLSEFFGRESEISVLREWILQPEAQGRKVRRTGSLITLSGPGGTGKTRLSLAVAESLLEHFSHAVWMVPMADISDASLLHHAICKALKIEPVEGAAALDVIVDTLRPQPALLVMDNLEQISAAAGAFLEQLLTRLPHLCCLVTSRQRLNLPGERCLAVGPLALPRAGEPLETLGDFASVQLFADRVCCVRSEWALHEGNAWAVGELCRRLEGIPLALELAAARSLVLTPQEMVAALGKRLDLLACDSPHLPPRHRSLRAAIDWSYQFLSPDLRAFYAALSLFRGGWTAEAAEEVAGEFVGANLLRVLGALGELRAASLISAAEVGNEMRFSMLETLRQFAAECLAGTLHEEPCKERMGRFFAGFAERGERNLQQGADASWLDRLEVEHENMRLVLAAETCEEDRVHLASSLSHFWMVRGYAREGQEQLARCLPSSVLVNEPKQRVSVRNGLGILAWVAGDLALARIHLEEALATLAEVGDLRNQAGVLNNLGIVSSQSGEWDAARSYYERALEIYVGEGYRVERAQVLSNAGAAALQAGDPATARRSLEEAHAFLRTGSHEMNRANVLQNLGNLAMSEQRWDEAFPHLLESLLLREKLRDSSNAINSYGTLAEVSLGAGRHEEALRWVAASQCLQEIADRSPEPAFAIARANILAAARRDLTAERFEEVWREGRHLAGGWADEAT